MIVNSQIDIWNKNIELLKNKIFKYNSSGLVFSFFIKHTEYNRVYCTYVLKLHTNIEYFVLDRSNFINWLYIHSRYLSFSSFSGKTIVI